MTDQRSPQRKPESPTDTLAEQSLEIIEKMQLGLYVYRLDDPDDERSLRLIRANPAAAQLTGISVEQCLDRKLPELFPGLHDRGASRLFAAVARSGGCQTVPELAYGDGRVNEAFWSFRVCPLPDRCVGVVFEDVTDLKKAKEETERQMRRLAALRNIDLAILSSLDVRITLQVLLDQVTTELQVDAADVLLYDVKVQRLEYAAGRGFRQPGIRRSRVRPGEGLAGRVIGSRSVVEVPHLDDAKDFSRADLIAEEDFVCYYGVPLIGKGELRGVLEIFHRTPLDPDEGWLEFLEALAGQAAVAIEDASLFEDLKRSNTELALSYDRTLEGWARALELRDIETEGHSRRVTEMTVALAQALQMSEEQLVHVRRGALLHDIGKLGIPDSILLKAGPLTEEEWVVMRKHPVYSYELLSPISFLNPALDIPRYHHERWDGKGYPHGLKGTEIPLAARIFAVVDAWDAMRSDRPYRKALSAQEALEQIVEGAGTQFDPQVVQVFLEERVYESCEVSSSMEATLHNFSRNLADELGESHEENAQPTDRKY